MVVLSWAATAKNMLYFELFRFECPSTEAHNHDNIYIISIIYSRKWIICTSSVLHASFGLTFTAFTETLRLWLVSVRFVFVLCSTFYAILSQAALKFQVTQMNTWQTSPTLVKLTTKTTQFESILTASLTVQFVYWQYVVNKVTLSFFNVYAMHVNTHEQNIS